MFLSKKYYKKGTVSLIITLILLVFPVISWAADSELPETEKPKKLQLVVGKSIILKNSKPVDRVSIANPAIAKVILLSPNEVYLIGKTAGITNLTIWQNKKICAIYNLEVDCDISRLKQQLHNILPDEKDIRVIATHNSITLSGRISDTNNLSQVMILAKEYASGGTVHNLVKVEEVHQVMLEVRIAEMSRSVTKNLGINWTYNRGGSFGLGLLGDLPLPEQRGVSITSELSSLFFKFENGISTWTGFIDLLKQNGLAKILAEPTLIALSGQTATFLAGGEFPIPVSEDDGIGIEYKQYGVSLAFTPTVLPEGRIRINVTPEVSEIDFSVAVLIGGYPAPGLLTRKTSTTVELADGQSFAIAGLLKDTVQDSISKFPFLGDIPVLGMLFRSRAFQKRETELIIIVTPRLVKPFDLEKQTLPTDEKQPSTVRVEFDGHFGHGMPYPD
ncbi:MAG: type II and III secretion system protein family protein [Deltaproteobacteria bacterium]|nr:type II and III secretion system protein family protein [Deltaproteobacteria bacterium]